MGASGVQSTVVQHSVPWHGHSYACRCKQPLAACLSGCGYCQRYPYYASNWVKPPHHCCSWPV